METTRYVPLNILPGVQPEADRTKTSTPHFAYSDKVRFVDGYPEKIKGWEQITFDYSDTIDGTVRTVFSEIINGKYYVILGSHKKLYALIGSRLTNITPLKTTSTTIANSLDTHYDTLTSNPFAVVDGSAVITVTDANAADYRVGDTVYFSGASSVGGIDPNGDTIIRTIGSGEYTINLGQAANATASGGGASVVRSSGLVTVNATAHGQSDGDRAKIDSATAFGGIDAGEINAEFIIRNSATNSFDVMTIGEATSSVSGGGGASTEYFVEIDDGLLNETNAQGYGAGLYGLGLYGTALTSTTARSFPRIWHADRYGNTIILTAGNQTGVYQWTGTTELAPELVANAPTTINYAFIQDNILVVLGEGGVENRVTGSDQGDIEEWTSSSINQVFRDDIEGAGRLISHCPLEDYSLLYTQNKTYKLRYIGLPFVWEISNLDESIGLIAPMARVPAEGKAFWMGLDNFYMFRGGTVEVIPSNSINESTVRKYVFEDLNWGQKSKCFAGYNKAYNEVWFHYPSANSNECDRAAVVNIIDWTWAIHTLDRTATEYPNVKLKNPRMINAATLYQHEIGYNDNGGALNFTLRSNNRFYGKSNASVISIIPDSYTNDDLTFQDEGKLFPQSSSTVYSTSNTITNTTEKLEITSSARFHQYTWSGANVDQYWRMGAWMEELRGGSPE